MKKKLRLYQACLLFVTVLWTSDLVAQISKTWTEKPNTGFEYVNGVGFNIGAKGYIGTGATNTLGSNLSKDFWEYDPSSNTWTQKANFAGTARSGAIGFGIGSKGYVGTGYTGSLTNDFWEYNPSINTWIQKANFGGAARSSAVGFSIDTKGYVGTGQDAGGNPTNDLWEYDPSDLSNGTDVNGNPMGKWTQKSSFGTSGRTSAVGFSIGSKGYIGTGYDPNGSLFNDFWEYNPASDSWLQKANFGGTARLAAIGFSIGNNGYLGLGQDAGDYPAGDFWEYNSSANTWMQKALFNGSSRYGAIAFSIDTKGYIGSGQSIDLYSNPLIDKDFWEYDAQEFITTPVAGGWLHSLYVCGDKSVKAMGDNGFGKLGDGTQNLSNKPVQVTGLTGVIAVACGQSSSLALKNNGTVWTWGANAGSTPGQVGGLTGITAIAGGPGHSLALKNDGTVWAWGTNSHGQLGDGTNTDRSAPVQVINLSKNIIAIAAGGKAFGQGFSMALGNDGTVYVWGGNEAGQLGLGAATMGSNTNSPLVAVGDPDAQSVLPDVAAIACGGFHSLALKKDRTVWAWGEAIANGSSSTNSTPSLVMGLSGITSVAAGNDQSLALKDDGTVWAWGINNNGGALGIPQYMGNQVNPIQVPGLSGITAIGAGYHHSLAVKNDGTVWTWGANDLGQIGQGFTGISQYTPSRVLAFTTSKTNESICGAHDGTATASPSGCSSSFTYFWSNGQITPTATNLIAGTYTITVTEAPGVTSSSSITINVAQPMMAVASSNSPVCSGGALNLTVSGGVTYSWTGPDNFSASVQTPEVSSFSAANEGTYSVTVTNSNGCTASATVTVALISPGASNNGPVCDSSTLSLSASGGTGYSWTGPNGFTSNLQNPSIVKVTGVNAGTYSVTVCNDWKQKTNFGGTARNSAVSFSIGDKGYVGTGWDTRPGFPITNDFWQYDPAGNTWSQKADFGGAARDGAIGFSIGSKGYIGIGRTGNGVLSNDFWEYDGNLNSWTKKSDFSGGASNSATGFGTSDKGYILTGAALWEYNQSSDSWSRKRDFPGVARAGAVGFSINNKGYIGTGEASGGTTSSATREFWEYDPGSDVWAQKANFGGSARWLAAGFSIGTKGYIGTGYDGANKNDFWEYDQLSDTWSQKVIFPGEARWLATGFSIGSKGYIATGNYTSSFGGLKNDFWEYSPGGCTPTVTTTAVINALPVITLQPVTQTAAIGGSASFTLTAAGSGLTYQWRKGAVNLTGGIKYSGASTSTLAISSIALTDVATNYNCRITTTAGCNLTSANAALTIGTIIPVITLQPALPSVTPCEGGIVSFKVTALGGALTYQWYKGPSPLANGANITGATGILLTINHLSLIDTGSYYVMITNPLGSVTSNVMNLSVNTKVVINSQPLATQLACVGSTATLTVGATGSGLTYQWKKYVTMINNGTTASGSIIFGATESVLTIDNVTSADAVKTYNCVVKGTCSTATTTNATIIVGAPAKPLAIAVPAGGAVVAPSDIYTYSIRKVANADSYTWAIKGGSATITEINGAGSSDTLISVTYNNIIPVKDTISVTANNGCGPSIETILVLTPNNPKNPGVITAQPGGAKVCPGDVYNYSIKKVPNAKTYTWTLKGGSGDITHPNGSGITDTVITVSYNLLINVRDTISVTANNTCGSSAESKLTILPNRPAMPVITAPVGSAKVCPGDIYIYKIRKSLLVTDVPHYDWITPASSSIIAGGGLSDTSITLQYNSTIPLRDTLFVRAGNNCSNSSYARLIITPNTPSKPVITVPFGGVKVCPGDIYQYSIRKSLLTTDIPHYEWIAPLSSTVLAGGDVTDTSIIVQYNTTIPVKDSLRVRAGSNCSISAYAVIYITPNSPFPRAITVPPGGSKVCPGNIYTYTIRRLNMVNDAVHYDWIAPASGTVVAGGDLTDTSITIEYATTIAVTDQLLVRVGNNCSNTAYTSVTIAPNSPVKPALIISQLGGTRVCPGDIYTYSIRKSANALGYTWTINGATGNIFHLNASGPADTIITVTYSGVLSSGNSISVTADNSCSSSAPVLLTILPNTPVMPGIISGAAFGVKSSTQSYNVTPVSGLTYSWSWAAPIPAGATINSSTGVAGENVTIDFTGTFCSGTLKVIATNTCNNLSVPRTLLIKGAPAAAPLINGTNSICALEAHTYSIDPIPGVTTGYTWTAPLGGIVSTGQGTTTADIIFGSTGGNVTVYGKNACGNGVVAVLPVSLNVNCRVKGPADIQESTLSLYPNPTSGIIAYGFESTEEIAGNIKIFDALGKVVMNKTVAVANGYNNYELDLRDYAKGIYMIMLSTEGEVRQGRIILE